MCLLAAHPLYEAKLNSVSTLQLMQKFSCSKESVSLDKDSLLSHVNLISFDSEACYLMKFSLASALLLLEIMCYSRSDSLGMLSCILSSDEHSLRKKNSLQVNVLGR